MDHARRRPLSSRAAAALLAAAALSLAPGAARAQGEPDGAIAAPGALDQIVTLNREGLAAFQRKKFEAARRALRQALAVCDEAGLERHPVTARTHVHLGVVLIAGFGERDLGARQFAEALAIDPRIALTPSLATPELQAAFDEAAALAPTPARATQDAPVEAPRPRVEAAADDDERPAEITSLGRRAALAPASGGRVALRVEAGRDDDDDDLPAPRLQLGLAVGLGAGSGGGSAELNGGTSAPGGFVGARLDHLEASAGTWLAPTWMLALAGRFERVSGATVVEANGRTYQPATAANAVFAALTWSPGPRDRLRPFLSAEVGAGRIRHVVTLAGLMDCGPSRAETCVDTVGGGPFLAGAGGGVTFALAEHVALVAAARAQLAAPRFIFNVDLDGGVAFRL
jgi:hypothetical protein